MRIGFLLILVSVWIFPFVHIYLLYGTRNLPVFLYIILTVMTYISAANYYMTCSYCTVCISNVWCNNIFVMVWISFSIITFAATVNYAWHTAAYVSIFIFICDGAILPIGIHYWIMIEILIGDAGVSDAEKVVIAGDMDDKKEELVLV